MVLTISNLRAKGDVLLRGARDFLWRHVDVVILGFDDLKSSCDFWRLKIHCGLR